MSCYREVVNDHGSYHENYSLSSDTFDILTSSNFGKPRMSLKGIFSLFPLKTKSISKEPRCHRFRRWLNKRPILDCLPDYPSQRSLQQYSSDTTYRPFEHIAQGSQLTVQTYRSLRRTLRQWFHDKIDHTGQNAGIGENCSRLNSIFGSPQSVKKDHLTCRLNLSASLLSRLDGPTAV